MSCVQGMSLYHISLELRSALMSLWVPFSLPTKVGGPVQRLYCRCRIGIWLLGARIQGNHGGRGAMTNAIDDQATVTGCD